MPSGCNRPRQAKEIVMDEIQDSEVTEVTPPEEATTAEQQGTSEEALESNPAQEENSQDRNWKELRKKEQDTQRREQEALDKVKIQEELIKNLLQSQQNLSQQQAQQQAPQEEVDEFAEISDSDFMDKGNTRRMNQKDARSIARDEFRRLEEEKEKQRFIPRLKEIYSDFDEVVNSEAVAKFEKLKPQLAKTIANMSDPFEMGLQTYEFIKLMSPSNGSSKDRHAKEVEKNIDKNEKSIQSPQAYDKRPMAQAFSMSQMGKEEKTKIYEEMMGYASHSGFSY